jgi:hypothetical protein
MTGRRGRELKDSPEDDPATPPRLDHFALALNNDWTQQSEQLMAVGQVPTRSSTEEPYIEEDEEGDEEPAKKKRKSE